MSEQILAEQKALFGRVQAELGIDNDINLARYSSVVELVEEAFKQYPQRAAFSSLGYTLSYSELDTLSGLFAAWLQNATDLQPGDRIAVQIPNLVQYPVVVLGAMRAGLVIVNTNPLYTAREIEHQFNDADVKALVVQANVASTVAAVLPRTGVKHVVVTELADLHPPLKRLLINNVAKYIKRMVPRFHIPGAISLREALKIGGRHNWQPHLCAADDLAMLQYTGGTTGVAKGAMLSHANLVANVLQADGIFDTHDLGDSVQIILQPLPVYHIYAFMTCLYSMLRGGHMVLIPNPRDLKSLVDAMARWPITLFCGLNTLFVALCNDAGFRQLDFSSLKVTLSGGMALTEDAANQWRELTGVTVSEGYGLTETSPVVSSNPGNAPKIGTIGVPVPGTELKVVDDQGVVLALGEAGELCVRGPQVMQGYWQRAEDTAEVLDEAGWLRTGDVAVIGEDGYVKIVDRIKDMIVVSGFNVYPNELEEVLVKHPDVVECAAVGVPDPVAGESVKMFVVRSTLSLSEAAVRDFCREQLTAYKVPRHVEFRDELPKTAVGKILRRELRDS